MSDDALIDALTAFAANDPTEAMRNARRAAAATSLNDTERNVGQAT